MTTLTVYDPPMCCSSGVCGPEVDPKLVQFASDVDWLKGLGVDVQRFSLSREPERFVANPAVKVILDESGGDDLPAIMTGDDLIASGYYPSRDELVAMLGIKPETMTDITPSVDAADSGKAPGASGCCGGKKSTTEQSSGCCGGQKSTIEQSSCCG